MFHSGGNGLNSSAYTQQSTPLKGAMPFLLYLMVVWGWDGVGLGFKRSCPLAHRLDWPHTSAVELKGQFVRSPLDTDRLASCQLF